MIDYKGEQFVVELKIWRGLKYHDEGEEQLCDYLDKMHLSKGYMLIYSFNQIKTIGLKRIERDGKTLIEAVV